MKNARVIGAVSVPLLAALLTGCGSGINSGTDNQQKSKPGMECLPGIDPGCPDDNTSSTPIVTKPSAHPTFTGSAPIRYGDWMFGQCSLSLWPAYVGLSFSDNHLVILASTACVGYQPQEIHIHLTLQKWWAPGGGKSDYHDVGVNLADNTKPPLVILPPEGEPPLSEQHKISGSVLCTPNNLQKAVPYRLRIDIVGVSYGGEPIVTGGYGSAFIVSNADC